MLLLFNGIFFLFIFLEKSILIGKIISSIWWIICFFFFLKRKEKMKGRKKYHQTMSMLWTREKDFEDFGNVSLINSFGCNPIEKEDRKNRKIDRKKFSSAHGLFCLRKPRVVRLGAIFQWCLFWPCQEVSIS